MKRFPIFAGLMLALMFVLTGCQTSGGMSKAAQIDRDADFALRKLYDSTPEARKLAARAKGILVFPGIVKGGFLFGAYYGDGALRKNGRTVGYYNNSAFSYGLQAGVQSFGYALFFMSDGALNYLNQSSGWEIGVGPSIVIVDAGMARNLTTTTLQHDIYGFVFDQKGLMAGLGLQGSKITRINP